MIEHLIHRPSALPSMINKVLERLILNKKLQTNETCLQNRLKLVLLSFGGTVNFIRWKTLSTATYLLI